MVSKQATVRNGYGIHCRPAAIIAGEARSYVGAIRAGGAQGEADAKSVLELVGLAAACGTSITVTVEGPDEEETCDHFVALFETEFDFER